MPDKRNSTSVLIVNQDPSILILLAAILERNGFRALLARSAEESVEISARQFVPIELVLCDVAVGGVPGQEVVRRIREHRPEVKDLYLATGVDDGAIRIRIMAPTEEGVFSAVGDLSLVDYVRNSLSKPLRAGA